MFYNYTFVYRTTIVRNMLKPGEGTSYKHRYVNRTDSTSYKTIPFVK